MRSLLQLNNWRREIELFVTGNESAAANNCLCYFQQLKLRPIKHSSYGGSQGMC